MRFSYEKYFYQNKSTLCINKIYVPNLCERSVRWLIACRYTTNKHLAHSYTLGNERGGAALTSL